MSVPSSALFASLGEAKKAGWIVRTRNAGPPDYWHFSATIFAADDPEFCEYLVSSDATWSRRDAKRHALDWINNHMANASRQRIGGKGEHNE